MSTVDMAQPTGSHILSIPNVVMKDTRTWDIPSPELGWGSRSRQRQVHGHIRLGNCASTKGREAIHRLDECLVSDRDVVVAHVPRRRLVFKATRSGLCPWEDTLRGKVRSIKQHMAPRFLRHGRSYVSLPHPPCLRWRGPRSDQLVSLSQR